MVELLQRIVHACIDTKFSFMYPYKTTANETGITNIYEEAEY